MQGIIFPFDCAPLCLRPLLAVTLLCCFAVWQAVNRLRTYHTNVDSVLDYYRDILVEVRLHICYCFHAFPCPIRAERQLALAGSGQLVVLSKSKCASDGNGASFVTSRPHGSVAAQVDGTRDMDSVFADIDAALDKVEAEVPAQAATA